MEILHRHNLRTDLHRKQLCQTGTVKSLGNFTDTLTGVTCTAAGFDLLPGDSIVSKDDVVYMFLARDERFMVFWENKCCQLDTLAAPPVGVVMSGDNLFVLLEHGFPPCKYTFTEGNWRKTVDVSGFPAPYYISRSDAGLYSAVMPALTLKGTYGSRSSHLTSTDAATIGNAMGAAYCSVAETARVERRFVQPVIARYRVRGKSGNVLYTSAPVIISADDAVQCRELTLTLAGADGNRVEEAVMTAMGFTPVLQPVESAWTTDGWSALAVSVELLVSPQFHLYQPGVAPIHSFGQFTASGGVLRVYLPGVEDALLLGREGSQFAARVALTLAHLDEALMPFEAERSDTLTEISLFRKLLSSHPSEMDVESRMLADLTPPHSFSARCAASGGDVLVWGNLAACRFQGYSAGELAVRFDPLSGAVPSACIVRFSDGSSVVSSATMLHVPTGFSALISYPHPDATSLEIRVGSRSEVFPLRRAPGSRWSYYLSPSLRPVEVHIENPAFVLPVASTPRSCYSDVIAVSKSDAPLALTAARRCGGEVRVISSTALPVSSWDFARANFYAFTDAGICAVTVNSRRDSLTSARIDRRVVTDSYAVAVTPDGVMAVASGDLVKLNSNRVLTLYPSLGDAKIGWSQPFGELWCVRDAHEDILVVNSKGVSQFTRGGIPVSSLVTSPCGLFAVTTAGDFMKLSEESDGECRVGYKVRCYPKSGSRRLLRLVLPLFANSAEGKVMVHADCGSESSSRLLAEFEVSGQLLRPIVACLPSPARQAYTVTVSLQGSGITIADNPLHPYAL